MTDGEEFYEEGGNRTWFSKTSDCPIKKKMPKINVGRGIKIKTKALNNKIQ